MQPKTEIIFSPFANFCAASTNAAGWE